MSNKECVERVIEIINGMIDEMCDCVMEERDCLEGVEELDRMLKVRTFLKELRKNVD